LQEKLGVTEFEIQKDGSIRLYEQLDNIYNVSKTLFENGVVPLKLNMNEANLEQYYINMVGDGNEKHNKGNELPGKKR
jgi:ABC-2 type transport system ATP-binding protein